MDRNQEIMMAASIVVAVSFVYIFLKASSITGNVVYEQDVLCTTGSDCAPDQSCCLFAGDVGGVCYSAKFCGEIADMSAQEYQSYLEAGILRTLPDEEEKAETQSILAATAVIVLGLLIIIYFAALEEKSKQKSFFS